MSWPPNLATPQSPPAPHIDNNINEEVSKAAVKLHHKQMNQITFDKIFEILRQADNEPIWETNGSDYRDVGIIEERKSIQKRIR